MEVSDGDGSFAWGNPKKRKKTAPPEDEPTIAGPLGPDLVEEAKQPEESPTVDVPGIGHVSRSVAEDIERSLSDEGPAPVGTITMDPL